ncbi:unnamed protein product [Cochlearia groenlandica]
MFGTSSGVVHYRGERAFLVSYLWSDFYRHRCNLIVQVSQTISLTAPFLTYSGAVVSVCSKVTSVGSGSGCGGRARNDGCLRARVVCIKNTRLY